MVTDLTFPGSVMLLKLVFKTTIEQEVKYVDVFKAFLNFPIDIAFLSFSFGSAVLYGLPLTSMRADTVKTILTFVIACIVVSGIITLLCKKSDKAFTKDKNVWSV
jgi:hypothetical protein